MIATSVERRLFTAAPSADAIVTRYGTFPVSASASQTAEDLSLDLQKNMGALEAVLARQASSDQPGLVVIDGPLRSGAHDRGTVGSIKTQHRSYGPSIVQQTVARLGAGQRTPVFVVSGAFPCWSWYLRLPGPVPHPMAAVVRCVVDANIARDVVIALADTVAATLPRFASSPAKDPRGAAEPVSDRGPRKQLAPPLGRSTTDPARTHSGVIGGCITVGPCASDR